MTLRGRFEVAGLLSALTAVLCWCTVPLFIKYFTDCFDVHTQNGLRYSVAALFWLPALAAMLRAGTVGRGIWTAAIWPSVINIIAQTTWAWAMYYIEPGIVGFVAQLNTIWATILAMMLLADERALLRTAAFWMGMAASTMGFVLMVGGHPQLKDRATVIGLAIMVAGSIPWGLYPVSVRLKVSRYPPVAAFAVIALYTAIGCNLLMLTIGKPGTVFAAGWHVHGWLVLSAILGIGVAHVVYYVAINRLGVAVTTGILLLNPFATAVLSLVLRGERLTPWQWAGGVGLVTGTACLVWAQQARQMPVSRRGQLLRAGSGRSGPES